MRKPVLPDKPHTAINVHRYIPVIFHIRTLAASYQLHTHKHTNIHTHNVHVYIPHMDNIGTHVDTLHTAQKYIRNINIRTYVHTYNIDTYLYTYIPQYHRTLSTCKIMYIPSHRQITIHTHIRLLTYISAHVHTATPACVTHRRYCFIRTYV
jgi:hypothetical protein